MTISMGKKDRNETRGKTEEERGVGMRECGGGSGGGRGNWRGYGRGAEGGDGRGGGGRLGAGRKKGETLFTHTERP